MKYAFIRKACLPFLAISAILFCRAEQAMAQDNKDRHKCIIESERYDVEITLSAGRKTTLSSTLLITGREGDIYTNIPIHYQKGDKVEIHYARIEDMNGNVIRKLKNSDINETQAISSSSMYEDYFVKYFRLLHNRYPYRLVYSYSITEHDYIQLLNIKNDDSRPIKESVVTLTLPDNFGGINTRYENVSEPEISKVEATKMDIKNADFTATKPAIKYTWRYSYYPNVEEVMPHEGSLRLPKITVTADEFEFGGIEGSMSSWEGFGNWYYALNEGLDELPDYEKATIDNMLAGVDDDMEKMKILYYYLQDRNRYVNVSMDIGGMKSYPASYVCVNRYGDCKALTTCMKAMLKHIGIESYTAAIHLGVNHPEVYDDFPNSATFNHVINVIPYKGDTIYLECTSKILPFGYIHDQIQGRKAILAKKSASHLINIPATKPEDVKCLYNYDINIDGEDNATVHIDNRLLGSRYELFNELALAHDKTTVDKYLRDNIYSGNYELLKYDIVREDRDTAKVSFTADFAAEGFSRIYGKNAVISNVPIYIPPFEQPDKRKSGVEINMPRYEEYMLTYNIPSIEPSALPEPVKIESKYGTYAIVYSYTAGKLVINKSILLNTGIYPLDEYPDFYNFISQIRKEEKSKLTLNIL